MSTALKMTPVDNERTTREALLAEIRARKVEFERLTYIPADIIAKMQDLGVYRAFVPKKLGGDAKTPSEFCELIEQIAAADASSGWVASFGVSATYLSALPSDTFNEIYGKDPDTVFAGAIFPPQTAHIVSDGFEVNGRWPYCSGCMGASLIGAGIRVEGGTSSGLPRMAVMPRERVSIKHTWDTIGLAATGSHDIEIKDVVVPEEWTFIRGAKTNQDDAVFHYPSLALAAQVLAVVALGTAREALDWLHREALDKPSITGAPSIGVRPHFQSDLAKAEAKLRSARAFFYDTIHEGYEQVLANGEVSRQTHIRLRLCATTAAHEGADIARMAYFMGGTSAIRTGHTLSRCMIDASAVAQHAFMGEGTWRAAGAAMMNQPATPGYP